MTSTESTPSASLLQLLPVRSGAAELKLAGLHLKELPTALRKLTRLQRLDVSQNQLELLPAWIGEFPMLQSLNVSTNKMSSLPEWLSGCKQLQLLNLSGNELTILPDWLGELTELQSIDFSFNPLTNFPDTVGQLTKLRSVVLSGIKAESLPDAIRQLKNLYELDFSNNQILSVPEWIGDLDQLRFFTLIGNNLSALPEALGRLKFLERLDVRRNQLSDVPPSIVGLSSLRDLWLGGNHLRRIPPCILQMDHLRWLTLEANSLSQVPSEIASLQNLEILYLHENDLTDLPPSLVEMTRLSTLKIKDNPLNPELAAAEEEGLEAVKRYLRARAGAQVILNEAKLILVGEGEVGKSCLLGALREEQWIDGSPTTHGIEIKLVKVIDPASGREITLNGWDFGGQRVYRPTHQLFFSSPAVYLVVWKPREGPQQGFVKEWIKLVKHREPDAKILVVATHGGPGQRQPDVDRQELWDLFGRDTVLDFFLVDSKPDESGERSGIAALKDAIAYAAASLPEMGRKVPARWQRAREALQQTGAAYLPLDRVYEICCDHEMDEDEAGLFVTISHRLGHLIYYEHDPALRDIIILKPDWLATAISFVLDDRQTRAAHGLVSSARLAELWDDPTREEEFRYPPVLHPVFLRLMERFDLSYRVAGLRDAGQQDGTSLIAQLVPDVRPEEELQQVWSPNVADGDEQQVQICKIVEMRSGQSAAAEGLFYQMIVRLHRYSLGRANYPESIHWQRGLVLDDNYNGRALLEYVGNDVRITVRAPYPERFLSALTYEVKWLVESFWAGLRCEVMVPCVAPCGKNAPGTGLFEVQKLIESKRRARPEYPCPLCSEWQNTDALLRNAPAAQRPGTKRLFEGFAEVKEELTGVRALLLLQHGETMGRFDGVDVGIQRLLSQVDDAFAGLMQDLNDEAKDGPRLFSFQPVEPGFFGRPNWVSQTFRLTLWCEHSRLPLSAINDGDSRGVYELNLPREWFVKAAPFLRVLTGTLSLVLPVASSATKFVLDDTSFKGIEEELDLGQKSLESILKGTETAGEWLGRSNAPDFEHGEPIAAHGAVLRQIHAWLKEKDPGFGGLVRVRNKRQEFLWVHPRFEKEY
jgi:Leucine-rich repeat (LRR) protein